MALLWFCSTKSDPYAVTCNYKPKRLKPPSVTKGKNPCFSKDIKIGLMTRTVSPSIVTIDVYSIANYGSIMKSIKQLFIREYKGG